MAQPPLNAVSEVSNFLIGRLERKPNWRREEVVEELEGALNDWVRKHNLVTVPVGPPLSTEVGAWITDTVDYLLNWSKALQEGLCVVEEREAHEVHEVVETAKHIASLEPTPRPAIPPLRSFTGSLRSTLYACFQTVRRWARQSIE